MMMGNNRRNKDRSKGLRRQVVAGSDKKNSKSEKITSKWRVNNNEINKELIRVALYPNTINSSSRNRIVSILNRRKSEQQSISTNYHYHEEEETEEVLSSTDSWTTPSDFPQHITWNGFEDFERVESTGQMCSLCEEDLSSDPLKEDNPYGDDFYYESRDEESEYYNYYNYKEDRLLPDVSVLACGHCFHSTCLESITPDYQSTDPPCFFCLSLS